MADVVKMFRDLIQELGEAKREVNNFSTDGKQLREQLEKTASTTKAAAEAQEKLNKAVNDGSKAETALAAANRNAASTFKDVSNNAEDATRKIERLTNQIKGYANNALSGLKSGNLATMFGGNAALSFLQEAHDRMQTLNRDLMVYSGATRGAAESTRGHAAALQNYRRDMIDVGKTMGISTEAATQYANSMMKMGFSQNEVNRTITIAGQQFKQLSAIQTAGVSAGLDAAESMDLFATSVQELGDSAEVATANIVMIGTAARNASTSARLLSPVIKGLQSDFRFFGLDTQKATDFIAKAAIGSKTAKVDMETMGQAIKGLKGASPGVQAYYGMGSSAIGGGRGAVGSSIQFEAALGGRGAGLDKAFEAITKRLTQASGSSGLVTRTMAEAGGAKEETAYFKQRAMVQTTMGMSQDQAGKFIEIMAAVKEQGGVANDKQKEQLDNLKKTEADWAADTYKIENEIKQKTDKLYNTMAPAGGSIKSLIEGMSATTMAVLAIGTNIVTAVLAQGAMSGLGKLFGGFKGAGGVGGAAGGATGGAGALSRNIFKNAGALKGVGRLGIAGGLIEGGMQAYNVKQQGGTIGQVAGVGASAAAGATLGGIGGSVIGAAIGTAIAPGIGTAIGKVLGGAVGSYFGGKLLGGVASRFMGVGQQGGALQGDDSQRLSLYRKMDEEGKDLSKEQQADLKNLELKEKINRAQEQNIKTISAWDKLCGTASYNKQVEIKQQEAAIAVMRKQIEEEEDKIATTKAGSEQQIQATEALAAYKKTLSEMMLKQTMTNVGGKLDDNALNLALQDAGFKDVTKEMVASVRAGSTEGLGLNGEGIDALNQALLKRAPKTASGTIALGSQIRQIGEAGPEAVIPLERFSEVMQQFNPSFAKQMSGGTGAGTAFANRSGGRGRGEPFSQEIKIKLEGEGVLAGVRKEIILCVEDGIVKGTRKTEHSIVR